MGRFGRWAPLVNTLPFALCHFDQPCNMPWLVVTILPMAYLVCWKRALRIGVSFHLVVNAVGVLDAAATYFGP